MAKQIFREKSIERISSPEQLNDYLKVTKPAVWVVLIAVILLLVGMVIWGAFTYIGSRVNGSAKVNNGLMTVNFADNELAENVEEGMTVNVDGEEFIITAVDYEKDGSIVAQAETDLKDGNYDVTVEYKQTQILGFLFGN